MPLFFVITGLSLNVGAVSGYGLALLALVSVIACAGKIGPAYAVSRASGLEPRHSAAIAALVNTRGLTELIALNVGLSADIIINQRLFTILVLMALLTTLMTGPLLSLIRPYGGQSPASGGRPANADTGAEPPANRFLHGDLRPGSSVGRSRSETSDRRPD